MTARKSNPIARWRDGADGFFRWLDDVKPMVPSHKGGYQCAEFSEREKAEIRRALDGGFGTVVFCWPRRHGKTVASALIVTWRFLTRRTQTIALVANSSTQAVDVAFKIVKTVITQTPTIKKLVDAGEVWVGTDEIRFDAMGSLIKGYPNNDAALYGKKLSVAQISELHAARDDKVFQNLSSATVDTEDGLVLVDSTVGSTSSPLYALYQLAERDGDPLLFYSYISYRDLEDACANCPPWITPEKLRSRAAQDLPARFAQQHLNQWSGSQNSLFPDDLIKRCVEAYALDPKAIADGRAYAVGGGLDRAYGFSLHGDSTITTAVVKVAGVNEDEPHFFVLASDKVRFSSAEGIKANLTRYHRDFGMKRAALEHYNSQDIAAWCAEQPFDSETVSPTRERQAQAFQVLYNAAAEGRLHINPSHERLIEELRTFEYELEATGTSQGMIPKFGHAKGCHDDTIYSLAWAVYSLREIELNPFEINGIRCTEKGPAARLCILNGGEHVPMCAETCRSFLAVHRLYGKYADRAGCAPLKLPDFFRYKVENIGVHSRPR